MHSTVVCSQWENKGSSPRLHRTRELDKQRCLLTSSPLSISLQAPDSVRCRPLGDWSCRRNIIYFNIGCFLQVHVLWYNFNKCIIPCFSIVRDDTKVEKYTYRNEMKIINKAHFHFHYSTSCSWRLQSQYDVNRTIRYDSYYT